MLVLLLAVGALAAIVLLGSTTSDDTFFFRKMNACVQWCDSNFTAPLRDPFVGYYETSSRSTEEICRELARMRGLDNMNMTSAEIINACKGFCNCQ